MRDVVTVNITTEVPTQVTAVPGANRGEIRFGDGYRLALLIDEAALLVLAEQVNYLRVQLAAAKPGRKR
ncbi:hypothetical protein [Labedaea rhizosphaerae]|uniref:Uncharacterized protein n=1 Tax=Labedaea rhizosphaerae TaxID=598644 RepID=A0A4R6S9S6_LABRH|nr:hypothetical protein [Labedaea rhizosphaerae]TDP96224.1 hypothetical protein EV186_104206 [Labedaea rhizosphaerae]